MLSSTTQYCLTFCLSLSIAPTVCHKLGSSETDPAIMLTGQSKSSQSFQFGPNTSIFSSLVPLKSSGGLMIIHARRFHQLFWRPAFFRTNPQYISTHIAASPSMSQLPAVVEQKLYLCFVSRVTSVAIRWNGDQPLLLSWSNDTLVRRQGRIFQVDFFSHSSKKSQRVCPPNRPDVVHTHGQELWLFAVNIRTLPCWCYYPNSCEKYFFRNSFPTAILPRCDRTGFAQGEPLVL